MISFVPGRFIVFFLIAFLGTGCGSTGQHSEGYDLSGSQDQSIEDAADKLKHLLPVGSDSDNDFIPDQEEERLGSDSSQSDENGNGVIDGLEGDPYFSWQWYLHNDSNQSICTTTTVETVAGNDLHLLPLYHYTFGATHHPMIIQVVDGGIDSNHEDLDISLAHSLNSLTGGRDPHPVEGISSNPVQIFYRGHGTAVAGIIGAEGLNHLGVRGVAPHVQIAGSNWLESEEIEALEPVWYSDDLADEISISTNSWGKKFIRDKSYEMIMAAARVLRGGKGRVFVFAAGNDREEHGNANLSYLINNPYAIAVAALNHSNRFASYSSPGSNILVSAYGGEHYYSAPTVMTTFSSGLSMSESELEGRKGPVTIDEDLNRNYTYAMNGTSAAAPMVSGALALVLDLCPDLSWRDIRWLIAKHAMMVDSEDQNWIMNAVGLWHSNNYGYGRINAVGMAAECLDPAYTKLSKAKNTVRTLSGLNLVIPDNNQSIEKTVHITEDIAIEWVGVTLHIDHPYAGDLDIDLISPSGTSVNLMEPNFIKSNAYKEGFRFATVSLMGEPSAGVWRVRVTDRLKEDNGVLHAITIEIRGHKK